MSYPRRLRPRCQSFAREFPGASDCLGKVTPATSTWATRVALPACLPTLRLTEISTVPCSPGAADSSRCSIPSENALRGKNSSADSPTPSSSRDNRRSRSRSEDREVGRAEIRVCCESRQSPVGADPNRPIARLTRESGEGFTEIAIYPYVCETRRKTTLKTNIARARRTHTLSRNRDRPVDSGLEGRRRGRSIQRFLGCSASPQYQLSEAGKATGRRDSRIPSKPRRSAVDWTIRAKIKP